MTPYQLGVNAGFDGLDISMNPFVYVSEIDCDDYYEWRNGWYYGHGGGDE